MKIMIKIKNLSKKRYAEEYVKYKDYDKMLDYISHSFWISRHHTNYVNENTDWGNCFNNFADLYCGLCEYKVSSQRFIDDTMQQYLDDPDKNPIIKDMIDQASDLREVKKLSIANNLILQYICLMGDEQQFAFFELALHDYENKTVNMEDVYRYIFTKTNTTPEDALISHLSGSKKDEAELNAYEIKCINKALEKGLMPAFNDFFYEQVKRFHDIVKPSFNLSDPELVKTITNGLTDKIYPTYSQNSHKVKVAFAKYTRSILLDAMVKFIGGDETLTYMAVQSSKGPVNMAEAIKVDGYKERSVSFDNFT
jgi:hypothetical protein